MSFLMKAGNYVETAKVYYQYKNMLYNEVGLNPGGRTEKLFEELNILSNKDLNFLEKISGNSQNYIPYSMWQTYFWTHIWFTSQTSKKEQGDICLDKY